MSYTIELEKLTDEQLEAFKIIDINAYKEEKENRSTYSDVDIRNGVMYTELDKAYFYLKPMYDNMRNTEVKKTITESGILTTIEKIFRWAKKRDIFYSKYNQAQPAPIEEIPAFVVTHDMVKTVETTPAPAPVIPNPEPVAEPVPAPEPEQAPGQSPLEAMSIEELNKIMASIPAVEKI